MKKLILCVLALLCALPYLSAQDDSKKGKHNKKASADTVQVTNVTGEENASVDLSEGQSDDSESGDNHFIPGLLHSSQDIYANNTSYTFSIAYFRARGLDNK